MRYFNQLTVLILSSFLAISAAYAQAQQVDNKPQSKPLNLHLQQLPQATTAETAERAAIEGYSLISYFEKGLAEKGKSEFQSTYNGKTYYFTSAEQVITFNADPKHYTPVFGELCPYSLAEGRHVAIDPTRFRIVGDQLLLFHRSKEMDALAEWDKSNDKNKILKRANGEHILFRF